MSWAYMYVLYGRQMTSDQAADGKSDRDMMWRMSVECSLKSVLCSRGVRFPFVRGDLRGLYGLRQDGRDEMGLDSGRTLEKPGRHDAERVYGSVRAFPGDDVPETFAIDDGSWDIHDIPTDIADLESLRAVPADRVGDVLDARIGILRRRYKLLKELADGVVAEAARGGDKASG